MPLSDYARSFDISTAGISWPAGDYCNLAMIAIAGEAIAQRVGSGLLVGDELGLGRWQAIGLRLRSGALVELIEYFEQPVKGFVVRAERGCDGPSVLDELLAAFGFDERDVIWKNAVIFSAG